MAQPMMEKALAGLDSLRMTRMGNGSYAYPDEAASRLYYALYHACWALLQSRSPPIPFDENPGYEGQSNYYAHKHLASHLASRPELHAINCSDWRSVLESARRERARADYEPEPVEDWRLRRFDHKVAKVVNELAAFLAREDT